jgi:hypothetical protein
LAVALLALFVFFALLLFAARQLAAVVFSSEASALDVKLLAWLDSNSSDHAWRSTDDGARTFERLRSIPRAQILRAPTPRGSRGKEAHRHGSWVVQADDFLATFTAQAIISWAEETRRFSDGLTAAGARTSARNSSVAWCDWRAACGANVHVRRLLAHIEGATGISREHYESLQIVRYLPGEYYRAHHDEWLVSTNRMRDVGMRNSRMYSSPRILTAFICKSWSGSNPPWLPNRTNAACPRCPPILPSDSEGIRLLSIAFDLRMSRPVRRGG